MLVRYKIPKTILWVVNLFLLFFLIFTLFRLVTFFAFRPQGASLKDLIPSFLMGVRYDLRWIALILLPIVLFSMIPRLSPFYSAKNKKWWTWYLAIVTFIVFFFFAADFGSFSYNRTRLDAGAMNFAEDFNTSVQMMWQTYPMVLMLAGLVIAVLLFRWMYHRSHWRVINRTEGLKIPYRRKYFFITALVLCFFIYGSLSWPPLSRNDSFRFRDSFKSYLAINPLQNFFATLRLRKPEFNEKKARDAFPLMAEWMQLPNTEKFSYRREVPPRSNALESRPNIILVICESFSMYKSTMSGNPLNTTPYFDKLRREGIFFDRCFSATFGTARGVFAILTGTPDVQLSKFSTRNTATLNQHTIINNFEGLIRNIDSVKIYQDGSYKSPQLNVWGISDKNLFLEANDVLRKQNKPFFAIIQTADNHRPFSIPKEDKDFERRIVPPDTL